MYRVGALLSIFLIIFSSLFAQEQMPQKAKIIYLSGAEYPRKIYANQIFELKLKLTIATEEFSNLKTEFEQNGIKVLNKESTWRRSDTNSFENTYYLKAQSSHFRLPDVSIEILLPNGLTERETFTFEPILPLALKKAPIFSGVSAIEMKVIGQKASTFDDENNIIVFEIEGKMANLEDFKINTVTKQGAESSSFSDPANLNMIYYVIIPKSVPLLEFEYFDINKSSYELIKIPNMPYDEKISTQSDINPKSSFELYKIATLALIALVLFVLFVTRKKFTYMFLLILPLGGIGYLLIPHESVLLKKGGVMYILPTKNSTIFFIADSEQMAKVLNERDEHLKVELEDGKIGWIKKGETLRINKN